MAAWLGRVSLGDAWYNMYSRLLRTKPVGSMAQSSDDLTELGEGSAAGLAKVLTTVDLVSLGVGSCVGTGMYVVAGLVAKAMAGPGVILSFIIAALASILSGVCYAEFGVRVPKTTGSAYTYSYVTVGEFVAFFIGWNLILEYLIGTAAGASALSSMFDSLANHSISNYMITHLGTLRGLGKGEDTYPDLLALFIALLVTVIIALGVRNSVGFNNVLNVVNLVVWVFMIIAGLFFLSASNWESGNFLPYGWSGVMQGAATCFYAFIGFDIIATTGEEAKNPNTSIPYAITASLVTCLTAYVSVSVILTLMVPYNLIDGSAPLMEMFAVHGFLWGKYTVAVGSIAGLTVSLLGSLFPMPRVIYAMARDGLLFRFLSHVSAFTHTPTVACVVSGSFAALLALLVSLRDLIEMMSIGTLLAYTLVSVCILLLRYQPDEQTDTHQFDSGEDVADLKNLDNGAVPTKDDQMLIGGSDGDGSSSYHAGGTEGEGDDSDFHTGHASLLKRLLGGHYYTLQLRLGMPDASARPTPATGRMVTRCTLLLFLMSFLFWSTVIFGVEEGTGAGAVFSGLMATLMAGSLAKLLILIIQQPMSGRKLPYMAPCVPFVPAAAILVNSYLMLKLSPLTWARFTIWCIIGLLIYGCYGVWHSTLELNAREQQAHASSYQRYDDHLDDTFSPDDNIHPQEQDERPYQGWSAPEERGHDYQQHNQYQQESQYDDQDGEQHQSQYEDNGEQHGYQSGPGGQYTSRGSRSRGRTNHGFDVGEEED
ncbi:probable cationic amino acid transporter [Siniperca chuatsi]|uniref:probable cationic amino acid transporter n=1 Tax=Siniperca chuatsi TaxID=119488 RepID=UPI001CE10AF7|nr:probable cationic amino acid transporter [Siniperca chuatsi]XP_044032001.1 probable cationic amino acid transporter [Siniperca chuatsi]XP_044032002.1 probable cationic amino acid transporter [Siniperca chuatsi]